MYSLKPEFLAALSFTVDDTKTLETLGESRGKQQLYVKQRPQILEGLRRHALIESTDSSNRLEGITAPPERLKALVEGTTKPQNRSEQEIAGYREALELVHQSGTEMPVSTSVILQLHQWIYRYLPDDGGHWKNTDNEIVEMDASGKVTRVRFKAVPAVSTPYAMNDLIEGYKIALDERRAPLIVMPLFVLDFLCIHPFRDGNGRVARLLTLMLLYRAGYEVGRYISLERIYEHSKESYYETLEASSQGWHESEHDVMPWLRYFWGVMIKAYKEFEERVGNLDAGRGSKSQRVRESILRKVVPFTAAELQREAPDVSRDTIRLVLREMKSEGLVVSEGRGRGARWRLVESPA